MARRLAFALVGVYLLVGYLAVRVMNIAPERCIVAYQRIVPYTRASAELGEVIRFRYSQTHEVYVVLITEHSFDLFARSCSPYSLCLSLGFFGLFLHLAVARGLQTRTPRGEALRWYSHGLTKSQGRAPGRISALWHAIPFQK
ncbi:hypothetical protein Ctob_004141 [Chrysochromulina tobinii]|uniref:Uncharacterized protein n=1 Tax=Chrysochromulina tobinii TaxID=1460289 RepID=A0A0M0J771_9EUKA|nr:hypothetical protein Ctob_004141 [Chrysochromulina tobinii]|eukprot:KOO22436.1 hypothetical protein Ctob_004141 [Chrysochromulina sp. CCMP291]